MLKRLVSEELRVQYVHVDTLIEAPQQYTPRTKAWICSSHGDDLLSSIYHQLLMSD